MQLPEFAASRAGKFKNLPPIICALDKKDGGRQMTAQIMQAAVRDAMRNVVMVSSFGFWAVLLGFVPVAAIHFLAA
jgi:hypothetical protein